MQIIIHGIFGDGGDFGTGAFGDMACHNMHPVFKVLQLGYPVSVQGQSNNPEERCLSSCSDCKKWFSLHVQIFRIWRMPRKVEVTWYDGGFHGMIPESLPEGKNLAR